MPQSNRDNFIKNLNCIAAGTVLYFVVVYRHWTEIHELKEALVYLVFYSISWGIGLSSLNVFSSGKNVFFSSLPIPTLTYIIDRLLLNLSSPSFAMGAPPPYWRSETNEIITNPTIERFFIVDIPWNIAMSLIFAIFCSIGFAFSNKIKFSINQYYLKRRYNREKYEFLVATANAILGTISAITATIIAVLNYNQSN